MLLETDLFKAISKCNDEVCFSSIFSKMYTFTTENISGYIKHFDIENKKTLTVGSSCDQVLNLAFYGARDITLYDVNSYAKYYFYLKIAAIKSLSYLEFQEFFFKHGYDFGNKDYYNKKMFSKDTFDKIKMTLRVLDYESYLFFDELFCLFDSKTIRENLFNDDEDRNYVIREFNSYLKDEDSYNKMKSLTTKIKFSYINGNIFYEDINGKFDNILLSNICTTVNTLDDFKKILSKISINNLNKDGSVLVGYLWDISYDQRLYKKDWKEAYKIPVLKEKLDAYITEYQYVKSPLSIVHNTDNHKDLVLIYRK